MKKLFFEQSEKNIRKLPLNFFKYIKKVLLIFLPIIPVLFFFIPPLYVGKIPIPADSVLGLYHPWRDISIAGYSPGKFPVKNPLTTDPVLQTYPWKYLVIENIKTGNFPLWNPYSFSGQPLLGNIQSAAFQITNLIFFILPFKISWAIQIISPIALTSFFMYLFLKSLNLSSISSLFGAFVISFSGFFVSWLTWGTVTNTAMWLPLILYSLNKIFAKVSFLWFLLLIFGYSQAVFSGHSQTAFYVFIASFAYQLYLFLKLKNLKPFYLSIISAFFGILIASPQLLPSMEFINLSARSIDQGFTPQREDWFLPLQNIVQLIAPDYFGNPTTYNYWGIWNYGEFVSFIGIIPLTLAIFAIIKRKPPLFFLGLAAAAILFATENPISKIPYVLNFLYFSSLQPSRIIFLFDFAFAILASYGLEVFLKAKFNKDIFLTPLTVLLALSAIFAYTVVNKSNFSNINNLNVVQISQNNLILPLAVIFVLLFIFSLTFFKIKKNLLVFALFALTIAELFRFAYKFIPFSKTEWVFPQTEVLNFLGNQPKPFRVITTDRRILHPNTSAVYSIESADGYDPLYLANYGQFVSVWQSNNPQAKRASFNRIITPQKIDSPLVNLLNVKYILTFDEISNQNFSKVFDEGITKLYENKNVLSRAFFVNEVTKVNSNEEEFEILLNPQKDLSKIATSTEFAFNTNNPKTHLKFAYYNDQSLGLEVQTDKEAPLVLTNNHYPGWIAQIDGQKTQIRQVDFMFQSIIVPTGKHLVEFKYRPQSFYNGLYLSAVGILLALISSILLWKKYR